MSTKKNGFLEEINKHPQYGAIKVTRFYVDGKLKIEIYDGTLHPTWEYKINAYSKYFYDNGTTEKLITHDDWKEQKFDPEGNLIEESVPCKYKKFFSNNNNVLLEHIVLPNTDSMKVIHSIDKSGRDLILPPGKIKVWMPAKVTTSCMPVYIQLLVPEHARRMTCARNFQDRVLCKVNQAKIIRIIDEEGWDHDQYDDYTKGDIIYRQIICYPFIDMCYPGKIVGMITTETEMTFYKACRTATGINVFVELLVPKNTKIKTQQLQQQPVSYIINSGASIKVAKIFDQYDNEYDECFSFVFKFGVGFKYKKNSLVKADQGIYCYKTKEPCLQWFSFRLVDYCLSFENKKLVEHYTIRPFKLFMSVDNQGKDLRLPDGEQFMLKAAVTENNIYVTVKLLVGADIKRVTCTRSDEHPTIVTVRVAGARTVKIYDTKGVEYQRAFAYVFDKNNKFEYCVGKDAVADGFNENPMHHSGKGISGHMTQDQVYYWHPKKFVVPFSLFD